MGAADLDRLRPGLRDTTRRQLNDDLAGLAAGTAMDNNSITNALLRDSGALSVIGRSANSSGDPADISASAASGAVLRESGSALGFGTVAAAGLASNSVVRAKIKTSTTSLTGTVTAGSQVDIALGAYAFWPALTANGSSMALQLDNAASPTADDGNLRIANGAVSDQDYDIAWRRIDAS